MCVDDVGGDGGTGAGADTGADASASPGRRGG